MAELMAPDRHTDNRHPPAHACRGHQVNCQAFPIIICEYIFYKVYTGGIYSFDGPCRALSRKILYQLSYYMCVIRTDMAMYKRVEPLNIFVQIVGFEGLPGASGRPLFRMSFIRGSTVLKMLCSIGPHRYM